MAKLKLSTLCLWGSVICLLGFPVAVAAYRFHWWSLDLSFNIIVVTLIASLTLLLISIIVFILSFKGNNRNAMIKTGTACLLLLFPAVGLVSQAIKGKSLPPIHDITTDTQHPPKFRALVALRGADSNPLDHGGHEIAAQQQVAYPDIKPIHTSLSQEEAFRRSVKTAAALSWRLVAQDRIKGRIEAVDTTLLWGFKDDIVIRIQPSNQGSRIDLRSVSRVGLSDLGANAARIKSFIDRFEQL